MNHRTLTPLALAARTYADTEHVPAPVAFLRVPFADASTHDRLVLVRLWQILTAGAGWSEAATWRFLTTDAAAPAPPSPYTTAQRTRAVHVGRAWFPGWRGSLD
jgi:hypothetical protein